MNTLVIIAIAAVCLLAGYTLYGRWLANKWGIDPKAKTPAYTKEDGKDYVPTDGWVVFAHQFSSIAGAGPVTGAIQAAAFGWLPVLLWILLGGIFFGAVTDFGALYASVKNEGKSMGLLIEKYIGKTGRKLFLLFCWLFTLIVIAAFADMVAGTFNAYTVTDGVASLAENAQVNGAAGTISILFMVFAVIFGLIQKQCKVSGWKEVVLGLVCTVAALGIGMNLPMVADKATWSYITFAYIFLASVLMWIILNFGPTGYVTDISLSFGSYIGKAIVPLFQPVGLGYWQIIVALIAGIAAKEVVVSSCSVLFGIQNITTAHGMTTMSATLGTLGFGPANAYALMVFCLLYVPCTATIATIHRELNSWKSTISILLYQLVTAWTCSCIAYHVCSLLF